MRVKPILIAAFVAIVWCSTQTASAQTNPLNLKDFGAVGDGVTNDGPALQAALDALAADGGGILFVPAGRYAIITPVAKDFGGASSITILGVESSTPVDINGFGDEVSRGLDLSSEFLPQTGATRVALSIYGVQTLLIHDVAFVGTPDIETDALVTLNLDRIEAATIRHCEFYGLSTQAAGGAIVKSVKSRISLEQSKFLGSTGNSSLNVPVVENLEWKGLSVTNCVFADYGQRPDLYSKTGSGTPLSWINIGNAAALTNDSPRREVAIRDVFLDEGGFLGISVMPRDYQPASAPIDLFYVSGLRMNVSNLGSAGNYVDTAQAMMIEDSRYEWSHNSDAAVFIINVGQAILDRLECTDGANTIRADSATGKLTVIDSIYDNLYSQAATTRVINTQPPDVDPVLYVREQYEARLGRAPDPAGHYYWSESILSCVNDVECLTNRQALFQSYLNSSPAANFSISGQVINAQDAPLSGAVVSLGGSQTVVTQTDANGRYVFSNLPTSGVYTVTPSNPNWSFDAPVVTVTTPAGDEAVNFVGRLNSYAVSGQITRADGSGISGASIRLSGAQDRATISDANGKYSFADLPPGVDYFVEVSRPNYSFSPAILSVVQLQSNQTVDFVGMIASYQVSGTIMKNGVPLPNVTVTISGPQTAVVTTGADGEYSFNLPAEQTYTITPSRANYAFTPASIVATNLTANQTSEFTARLNYGVPVLVSNASSTRAIAFDSVLGTIEPFKSSYDYSWSLDRRTRIIVVATNFELLWGETATTVTADAQDASGRTYNLTVEYVGKYSEFNWLNCIVLRLSDDLGDVGDVLLRITYHGVTSNRVRVGIGHVGGGPPDDVYSVPTPGSQP